MIPVNAVCRVCSFLFKARRDDEAWLSPAKRSNAAMDKNERAMDMVFAGIMGI